jgi:uncharacterized protein YfaS (alpha-2-macroglobulin family)
VTQFSQLAAVLEPLSTGSITGKFSVLPTRTAAMYAPELKANSDEFKIGVKD